MAESTRARRGLPGPVSSAEEVVLPYLEAVLDELEQINRSLKALQPEKRPPSIATTPYRPPESTTTPPETTPKLAIRRKRTKKGK